MRTYLSNTTKLLVLLTPLFMNAPHMATAQERSSSSLWLKAHPANDIVIPYTPSDEGIRLPIRWGLDVAWVSEQNIRKGINHIGRDDITIARSSFQTTRPLTDDVALTSGQIDTLRIRTNLINLINNYVDIVLNEDQEAGIDEYYVKKGKADNNHWLNLITASVKWIHDNSQHKVIALSPYNEPDYGWGQGSMADMKELSKLLKESPITKDIAIAGGNTLNNDRASEWYNYLKPYVDWGNTHQLAGSFDTYADFFAEVTKDGLHPYADELHNTCEAMVGAEYGMKTGIWWGFDSRARGEFCNISNHGSRIAYGEVRNKWTAASIYRHDDGRLKAFVGTSERQANTSSFLFVNRERPVYYNGDGPTYEWHMEIPGGTGYQQGQTNAECVIDITWGEDVPSKVINGSYLIVNKATGTLLSQSADKIDLTKQGNSSKLQQWEMTPVDKRIGGDYSFYRIVSVNDNRNIDVKNFSCLPDAEIIAYGNETPSSNQQWYLTYAGDGCYYMRNRESGLYLTAKSKYAINHVGVTQNELLSGEDALRQQWRILPIDAKYDTTAPTQPKELTAVANNASVCLQWKANTESDLAGYHVLRTEKGKDEWNTIARGLTATTYTDNTCQQGTSYIYRLLALDLSDNRSVSSETVEATPTGAKGLVARWHMDDNILDETANMMDLALQGTTVFTNDHQSGEKALSLNGSSWLQLPYRVADSETLTVAMWVKWFNISKSWTRLFDFGTDTDHYIFLTPKADNNVMRLAIKNGGEEQTLDCPSRLTGASWQHVAVTFGKEKTTIYVNGEEVASSKLTIRPNEVQPLLNYIGRSQFASDPLFQGYIDDVQLFNKELSIEEVKEVMNSLTNSLSSIPAMPKKASASYLISGQPSHQTKGGRPHRIIINNGKKKVIN